MSALRLETLAFLNCCGQKTVEVVDDDSAFAETLDFAIAVNFVFFRSFDYAKKKKLLI